MHFSLIPYLSKDAVITAVPFPTIFTKPVLSTVATLPLLVFHVISVLIFVVAFSLKLVIFESVIFLLDSEILSSAFSVV